MDQIICKNLAIGYEDKIQKNLNFTIHEGEFLCILGENGVGKSTLMNTLLTLQKPLDGEIIRYISQNEIGYLAQLKNVRKDFPATVNEVVSSGIRSQKKLFPFFTKKERQLAQSMMQELKIEEFAQKHYAELSGGQQQRVLLARALLSTKKALFLDEPVTGLDALVKQDMYQIVDDLHRKQVTVVMISHDVEEALKHADHILYLGDEMFYGTTEEFMKTSVYQSYAKEEAEC